MMNSERKRQEAENRVRKAISLIPRDYIEDFFEDFDRNLRNSGSHKTVKDIIRECQIQHPH